MATLDSTLWPAQGHRTSSRTLRLARYAWGVLAYNVLVVLWGAYVRASDSGNGCGAHWPACGGSLIPHPQHAATWIELTHRLSIGLLTPLLIVLLVGAFRAFGKGHPARRGAVWILVFTFLEAYIGRHLVVKELVGHNESPERAFWLPIHLANTFALFAALALTAWWAQGGARLRLKNQGALGAAIGFVLLSVIGLAITGAIAALGDTLHPVASLAEGLRQDAAPTASAIIRSRPLHPYAALNIGLLLYLVLGVTWQLRPSPQGRKWAQAAGALFTLQLAIGLEDLLLLAPQWMQIVHLLVGVSLWISLVLWAACALSEGVPHIERQAIAGAELTLEKTTWRDYLALTKPRVISLLLFTTLAAMFIAGRGWPGLGLFAATGLGLYMAAGAANAINMVLERDLDIRMARTATRPTLTQKVSPDKALWFAFGLALGSFVLLWRAATLLSASMALCGLVVYVIVYTLLLKRRTWSNIVIGGAAGAFPPLVGWAAVTGDLGPLAWCLFALIFVWTPVHFWALAILIKDDYAAAGVPMLPVVLGVRHTTLQIVAYAMATITVSMLPVLLGAGWIYAVAALGLNGLLLAYSLGLLQQPERAQASKLFHYSMLYLALLFLALAVDARWAFHIL